MFEGTVFSSCPYSPKFATGQTPAWQTNRSISCLWPIRLIPCCSPSFCGVRIFLHLSYSSLLMKLDRCTIKKDIELSSRVASCPWALEASTPLPCPLFIEHDARSDIKVWHVFVKRVEPTKWQSAEVGYIWSYGGSDFEFFRRMKRTAGKAWPKGYFRISFIATIKKSSPLPENSPTYSGGGFLDIRGLTSGQQDIEGLP